MRYIINTRKPDGGFSSFEFESEEMKQILPTLPESRCTLENKDGSLYECDESAESLSKKTGLPIYKQEIL